MIGSSEEETLPPKPDVWTSPNSGAKSSGKLPPYHLIPFDVFAARLSARYKMGIDKGYEKDNWRKGLGDQEYIADRCNHTLEHLLRAISDLTNGIRQHDDDLAAVIWGAIFMMAAQDQNNLTPEVPF
jgi:hypothetical protein